MQRLVSFIGFYFFANIAMAVSPPIAPVQEVTDILHGVTVKDPYRYMEDIKDPTVQKWLVAQGTSTRADLDKIALRDQIEKRMDELSNSKGAAIDGLTRMPGERLYYLKRSSGDRQSALVMRIGIKGAERVLVDPEVAAQRTGVRYAINYFVPSWDGKYVAYGVSALGSEVKSLAILEVSSGKTIGKLIPRVQDALVSWLPDSKSLTFNQLKAQNEDDIQTEAYVDNSVMWLKVGDPEAKARPVFGPAVTKNLGLGQSDVGTMIFAPGSPWVLARSTDASSPDGSLFFARVADLGTSNLVWRKIAGAKDKVSGVELRGEELFFHTQQNAPRRHVMKLDLRTPDLKMALEVAVPPKDTVLEGFALTKDGLVAEIREGTGIMLRRYAKGDSVGVAIKMPFKGAAGIFRDAAHSSNDVLYGLNGWSQLPRIFMLKGDVSNDAGLGVDPRSLKLPEVEVVDVKVASHDGVMVPMTLLYKKGLKRDGTNPTLIEAFGAFGFSMTAQFSAPHMVWIEQGGVIAYPNVRGSGVYGTDWYQAGFKATKSNTWKDGIACAKYLIAEGYASPKTLGVWGATAGGIFAGRTVTAAPELFAAAIFDVGILDAVHAEESGDPAVNSAEYGTAKRADEFPALLDMSTYHQIKDNTAYPAVMLVHGINDPQVDVWQSAKTAARLRAASNSGKPIMLRLDLHVSHSVGRTANQPNALPADIFSFLLWQMGKTTMIN